MKELSALLHSGGVQACSQFITLNKQRVLPLQRGGPSDGVAEPGTDGMNHLLPLFGCTRTFPKMECGAHALKPKKQKINTPLLVEKTRSRTSLYTCEFLSADGAVNPRRGEQRQTTAEKRELQLGHFSSLQPESLCEAMAPGPLHSADLYGFTNLLAEESPHIITNDSPEPRRMG
ncbi:hypothetical protein FQN60_009338 [Etheostoma spectabile]|uniref:Uncharacterized protein n=1 Tax=Etheostoma spectabile TaxID=54343 RepID=A0A5J5DIS0_9PERO|nr:hypothetical protein FQN60_009338 [Etheostoma spectabile]